MWSEWWWPQMFEKINHNSHQVHSFYTRCVNLMNFTNDVDWITWSEVQVSGQDAQVIIPVCLSWPVHFFRHPITMNLISSYYIIHSLSGCDIQTTTPIWSTSMLLGRMYFMHFAGHFLKVLVGSPIWKEQVKLILLLLMSQKSGQPDELGNIYIYINIHIYPWLWEEG